MNETTPLFIRGAVVIGFGRGGKDLGFPTANIDPEAFKVDSVEDIGVYYGWSQVDSGAVLPMVMSVGWNPHFENEKKTVEVHILESFDEDFYGQTIGVIAIGYIRPMKAFQSLDALIRMIDDDIDCAKIALGTEEALKYKTHQFWK